MSDVSRRYLTPLVGGWLCLSACLGAEAADSRGPGGLSGNAEITHPVVAGFERFSNEGRSDLERGGRLLLGELNCTSCHRAGGAAEAQVDRKQAPILDSVGSRVRPDFLRSFLADPHATKPGTTMPNVLGSLPEGQRREAVESLTHFLASTGGSTETNPDSKAVERGRLLFRQVGCLACHDPVEGQATHLATSVPFGPLAKKYTIAGLTAFLADPLKVRPSGRMPALNLNGQEASDVASYLLRGLLVNTPPTMTYAYAEGSWQKLPDLDSVKFADRGKCLGFDLGVAKRPNDFLLKFSGFLRIDRQGEYTFAVTSDDGSKLFIDDRLIVDNDGIHPPGEKHGTIRLTKGMHPLVAVVFNGGGESVLDVEYQGPGLSRQSIAPAIYPTEVVPKKEEDRSRFRVDPELAEKGRELFAKVGCASCHQLGRDGKPIESTLTAAPLNKLGRDGGCLAPAHDHGTGMYRLSARQREALAAALLALEGSSPGGPAQVASPGETVARTMTRFNCYACHQRDGIGGVEDGRNDRFQTAQKEMGDEGRIPPHLNGVGAKIQPDYLRNLFDEGAKDRPYMLTRMPRFGEANVGALVKAFPALDTIEPVATPEFGLPPRRVKSTGRFLTGSEALGCIKCHTFKGVKSEGVQAIDMTTMTRRLNHDWFHRYLLDPQAYRPGTRMPAAWPMGKSMLPKLLDGSTARQIESIWRFLSDGGNAAEPYGLGRDPIPLVPEGETILYRNFIQGAGPRAIAVGYPEKANLAFDANDMRIALIWQGKFMDASRHWTGRGEGFQPPLGDNVLSLPTGPPLAKLVKETDEWPSKPSKESGYAFHGYRLSRDGRPTFLYDFGPIHIEDFPDARALGDSPSLLRTLTLNASETPEKVWFRAAVGDTIEPGAGGWYTVNGEWKLRVDSGAPPVVRRAGGKAELLVPVKFSGRAAKVVEEFAW